jgi:hypothetical protein
MIRVEHGLLENFKPVPHVAGHGSHSHSNYLPTTTAKPEFFSGKLLQKLNALAPRTSRAAVDFLLNVRKLVIYAVHELNARVNCTTNTVCPKWWANPVKAIDLNTKCEAGPPGGGNAGGFCEHDLEFMAEPGPVAFAVKIRQNRLKLDSDLDIPELLVIGNFSRLQSVTDAEVYAPPIEMSPEALNSYNAADNELDPELYSWKRHIPFLVGDYIDFEAKFEELYPISPKDKEKGLAEDTYCGSALKMLIMVSSAPPHFENRKIIRESYGSEENLLKKQMRLVFLFGKVEDATLQGQLEAEAKEHGDLIQANFMDSYHNLSLSHLLMYNWVQRTCEQVGLPKYVYKADDDFFLNVDLAMQIAYANPQYELIGTLYCGTPPIRHIAYMTKYYTPRYMYAADVYVGYLSGVAYLLRTDIIPAILKISLTTPQIHMDDVYMTGILPRQLGIIPVASQMFTYVRTPPDACELKKVACSSAENVEDIRVQFNEWVKPAPGNCSHERYISDNLVIKPLKLQDKIGCIFR